MDEREYGHYLAEVEQIDEVAEWGTLTLMDDEGYDDRAPDACLDAFFSEPIYRPDYRGISL